MMVVEKPKHVAALFLFILFKPTHALFLKHIHIHIWNTKLLKRRSPEDGQTIVTETCRVLMMCFTNIFNNLVF